MVLKLTTTSYRANMDQKKIKVLYIEDNEFDQLSFKNTLASFPKIEYTIVKTIAEGKDHLEKDEYDIIISDHKLPDGNAFTVLGLKYDIPVVIITGSGDEEVAANAIKSGARDYLVKDVGRKYLQILPVVIEKTIHTFEAEKAEALLASIVETAGDAILTFNLDHEIATWNKGAEMIYGYSSDEAKGMSFLVLFRDPDKDEIRELTGKVNQEQVTIFKEMIHLDKNGKHIEVYLSLSPIWNKKGNVSCYSVIAKDITEIKKKEQQLFISQLEIQKRKELEIKKDEFIGIASHELKTPLTSVKAYIQLLERQIMNHSLKESQVLPYLSKSKTYIKRLELLVNDLLDVSKIQAGKMVYNMKPFDVDEMLKEAIDFIRPLSEKHHIVIAEKANTTVVADKLKIEEVITNFLTNAIKYSPDNKDIIVSAQANGNDLTVSVTDQGIGISKQNIPHLFERYYRVKDNTFRFTGLGIGLFISKVIIDAHNGTIDVDSEPGKGSKFSFTIPVNKE